MVHRDIKPGNLMLTHKGGEAMIKVLDFGLAKAGSEQQLLGAIPARTQRESSGTGGLTLAGQMLGTPEYIAPEQIVNAQRADIRADIYSLGCTLYYLPSGRPPFQGTTLQEILRAHHFMEALLLNYVRPEVPAELAAVAAKQVGSGSKTNTCPAKSGSPRPPPRTVEICGSRLILKPTAVFWR
jgi:serine/threonine protein kinase